MQPHWGTHRGGYFGCSFLPGDIITPLLRGTPRLGLALDPELARPALSLSDTKCANAIKQGLGI